MAAISPLAIHALALVNLCRYDILLSLLLSWPSQYLNQNGLCLEVIYWLTHLELLT